MGAMPPKGIGLRIRERRLKMGLTPNEAGSLAGISGSHWTTIETLHDTRPPARLKEIAAVLKTTEGALLGDCSVS